MHLLVDSRGVTKYRFCCGDVKKIYYFCILMNTYHRNKYGGLKWTLLVLFSLYMAGVTFFTHSHVIDNVRIVHSHPYKNKPQKHDHTVADLLVIDQITHFSSTTRVVPHFTFEEKSVFLGFIQPKPIDIFIANRLHASISLRAPPSSAASHHFLIHCASNRLSASL